VGIIFMGTPYQGTKHKFFGADVHAANANNTVAKHLTTDSEMLQRQFEQYLPISKMYPTHYVYEKLGAPMSGFALEKNEKKEKQIVRCRLNIRLLIFYDLLLQHVDVENSGLRKDYENLVKFSSEQDKDYKIVRRLMAHMMNKALEKPTLVGRGGSSVEWLGPYRQPYRHQ
jgi:hypothetical protein